MDALCPICHQGLEKRLDRFVCPAGHGEFVQRAQCPDCGKPLEILAACGAVDFFCPHGDGLISKKRVTVEYQPL